MNKNKRNKRWNKNLPESKGNPASILLGLGVLLLLPLIYSNSTIEPVIYPRFFTLALVLLLVLVYLIFSSSRKSSFTFTVSGFFITVFFYLVISVLGIAFAFNKIEGLFDILKWLLFLMLTWLISETYKQQPAALILWLKFILISAAIALVIGFVQYFKYSFQNNDPNALYEVEGLMAHKNQYVISLFLMLPFVFTSMFWLNKSWYKLALFETIGIGIAILFLQTRSVWIAVLIAGAFSCILALSHKNLKQQLKLSFSKMKRIALPAVAIILVFVGFIILAPNIEPVKKIKEKAVSIFDEGNTSNAWRIEMWSASFDLIQDNLIVGVGAGNWKLTIYPYYSRFLPSVYRHWRNPHNDFILIASEKGIPGLIAYLAIFGFLFYYIFKLLEIVKVRKDGILFLSLFFGLIGILIISFFSFPYDRINPLIYLALMSAIIWIQFSKTKTTNLKRIKIPIKKSAFLLIPLFAFILYFGWIGLKMETNIAIAQQAEKNRDWKKLKDFALKAQHPLNPIEPRHSFPVATYAGLAYFHLDADYSKALEYFKVANRQHPTSIRVLNNMGSTYGKLKQYDLSLAYYLKTLEIFPHYEFGLINSARVYYLLEDYDQAYRCILSCDPKSSNPEISGMRKLIEDKLWSE